MCAINHNLLNKLQNNSYLHSTVWWTHFYFRKVVTVSHRSALGAGQVSVNNHTKWNHICFIQKQSHASWAIFFYIISIHPQKFHSKPAFVEVPCSAVLSDGKPRNCWDPSVVSHKQCVTWRLIHGNLFWWCDSVALLSFSWYDSLPTDDNG